MPGFAHGENHVRFPGLLQAGQHAVLQQLGPRLPHQSTHTNPRRATKRNSLPVTIPGFGVLWAPARPVASRPTQTTSAKRTVTRTVVPVRLRRQYCRSSSMMRCSWVIVGSFSRAVAGYLGRLVPLPSLSSPETALTWLDSKTRGDGCQVSGVGRLTASGIRLGVIIVNRATVVARWLSGVRSPLQRTANWELETGNSRPQGAANCSLLTD